MFSPFFFFNDTATTEIYTLSLHDALPIFPRVVGGSNQKGVDLASRFYEAIIDAPIKPMATIKEAEAVKVVENSFREDRKSTRLNSSHGYISYAVFCLKKKKKEHATNWSVN